MLTPIWRGLNFSIIVAMVFQNHDIRNRLFCSRFLIVKLSYLINNYGICECYIINLVYIANSFIF